MTSETYLNHPTFGLLYSICTFEKDRSLFTTLYAQRLFFIVTQNQEGVKFDPITRNEARIIAESVIRLLRRDNAKADYDRLQKIHRQIF